jgi:NADPH:quinone reductase
MRSRAIVMRAYGPPEVLQLEEVELAPLAPDELRLRNIASAVNHSDLRIRAGDWPVLTPEPFPYVPGLEAVGEVVEIGAEVDSIAVGTRAPTIMQGLGGVRPTRSGGYAEHTTVAADACAELSENADPLAVAALGLAAITGYEALRPFGSLNGLRVLVTGASGGVGSATVGLARAQGAEVIGVVSRPERIDYVRSLGASQVVVSGDGPIEDAVGRRSIDRVLDTVGGELFPQCVNTLKTGGVLSLVGAVAGPELRLDGWNLVRPVTLTGYTSHALDGPALRAAIAEFCGLLDGGGLVPPAQRLVPLSEAAAAHRLLEEHGVEGRVLLVPDI